VQATFVKRYGSDFVRLLNLYKNNGKGGAVRKGMVRARGQYLLFADADGATREFEIKPVLQQLKDVEKHGLGMAIGSRAHLEEAGDSKAKRTVLRRFLMWGFHTLINVLIGSSHIKDTQCGFKMFTRPAAKLIFPVQHIDRWAFDVELIYLAAHHSIPIVVSCIFCICGAVWRE
jgi:dolichyl-phosphate beta-glucosyltransferase